MVSRAEHRRITLEKLGAAAVALFEEQGATATIDAIAQRAGVSRRTVFRYIDTKEELAYVQPLLWFDVFDQATQANADQPLSLRLQLGAQAIASYIDADPEIARRAFAVSLQHPALMRGYASIFHRWITRIANEVLLDLNPADDLSARFRARILGSATMGVIDAVTLEWVTGNTQQTFSQLLQQAFVTLEPLWAQLEIQAASQP